MFWFKAASRLCWMVGHSQQPEEGTEQDMRLPQIPQRSHLWGPLTKWGWQTAGCEWGWRRTSCSERERSARQTNSPEGRRVEGRVKSDDRSLVCTILIIGTKKKATPPTSPPAGALSSSLQRPSSLWGHFFQVRISTRATCSRFEAAG